MIKIKGYKQSKKVASYIKRMITSKKWSVGSMVPAISTLSKNLSVSSVTIKKILDIFEMSRAIEKIDRGYIIRPISYSWMYENNKTGFYLMESSRLLSIAEMLNNEAIFFNDYVIQITDQKVKILNITTKDIIIKDIQFFNDIVNNPVKVQDMLSLKGTELRKAKATFNKQQQFKHLAEVVIRLQNDIH